MSVLRCVLAAAIVGCGSADAAGFRLPEGPGVDQVYAKCQTCHDLQYVVDAKGLLPSQWRAVLQGMKGYGLKLTDPEEKQIAHYLETYLGPHPPAAGTQQPAATADGAEVYAHSCAACHGAEGRGKPGSFPPLAGNPDLARNGDFPVLVVLHGLSGPIDVKGDVFDGSMPPFDHLSDIEIAAVVNHVRGAWGNSAPRAVTAEQVARLRKRDLRPSQVREARSH